MTPSAAADLSDELPPPGRPQLWRRAVAVTMCLLLVAVVSVLLLRSWPFGGNYAELPLRVMGVAVAPDGSRTAIAPGSDLVYLPGSRVAVLDLDAATPEEEATAQAHRDWLAAGTIPGLGGEFEDMSADALLDLHALTLENGAVVAGWSPKWMYVWPRDTAFVAWALARTGHVEDALRSLEVLQSAQSPDGSFEARYLPDVSGVPDDRGVQTDATGWALWSVAMVVSEIDDPEERVAAAARLEPLIMRSTDHVLALTKDGTSLPPASPDYWEVATKRLTLGTCAPLAMALTAAPELLRELGDGTRAAEVEEAAATFDALMRSSFAPDFGRFRGSAAVDTAVAFLLPPFAPAQDDVLQAWQEAPASMARPAGGLAPGAGWKRDGISWTPTTTVFALTAAATGDDELAVHWLRWVDDHRTSMGAIPEKVLHDGAPASLAPLAWSSANVLLALSFLDERTSEPSSSPTER